MSAAEILPILGFMNAPEVWIEMQFFGGRGAKLFMLQSIGSYLSFLSPPNLKKKKILIETHCQ